MSGRWRASARTPRRSRRTRRSGGSSASRRSTACSLLQRCAAAVPADIKDGMHHHSDRYCIERARGHRLFHMAFSFASVYLSRFPRRVCSSGLHDKHLLCWCHSQQRCLVQSQAAKERMEAAREEHPMVSTCHAVCLSQQAVCGWYMSGRTASWIP